MWWRLPDQAPIHMISTCRDVRFGCESNSPVTEHPEITLGEMTLPCPTVWVDLVPLCSCCHVAMSALNLFGALVNWSCCCGSAPHRMELKEASGSFSQGWECWKDDMEQIVRVADVATGIDICIDWRRGGISLSPYKMANVCSVCFRFHHTVTVSVWVF
jgi:hypothetical protein